MRELDVLGVRVEMPTNQPIVLLRERDGERYLPIWIGAAEATAIAYAQQGVVPPRPLTHDLLKNVIEDLGHTLTEVRIVALQDSVFHAEPRSSTAGVEVSARSSDAIALALRTGTDDPRRGGAARRGRGRHRPGGGRRGRAVQGVPRPGVGRGLRDHRRARDPASEPALRREPVRRRLARSRPSTLDLDADDLTPACRATPSVTPGLEYVVIDAPVRRPYSQRTPRAS